MKQLCACGCGQYTKGGKYLRGHNVRQAAKQSIEEPKLRVHIYPSFGDQDLGDGGVRRVVEGQLKHLPHYGIEIVEKAEEADLIACHITSPSAYVKRFADKPFVACIHGLYWEGYEWENWALKANKEVMELIRIADAVTVPSEWVANNIRRHTNRDVYVIPHGIDIEDWQPEEPLEYVLWNKTRPDPVCDPEPMVKVAELLPNIQFVSTFGRETANVKLTGRLPFEASKKLLEKAGVYLCTARETFGIGTLEAMACGVPVVGYRWGGQAEFLEHGVDSWLVTPEDINGLAEGIKWAFENRDQISIAAIANVKKFTWDKAAKQYAELFHKVSNKRTLQNPRTSIIVTNYNLHEYLTECLKSVQDQTDQDWECIIVDDASTNESGKVIANSFIKSDSRFKLIENQTNQYLSEARNIGIRAAKGKYILPLDADDMLTENAVKFLATALDLDKSIHISYGNVFFVDQDRLPIRFDSRLEAGHSGWPINFAFENQIIHRNCLPYSSMFRKEAWEAVGGYRRRQRTAEDAEFWVRLSSYGFRPKMITNEDTLIYRIRPNSMSANNPGVYSDWLQWFSWAKDPVLVPAGAVTAEQKPINSLDPIVVSVIIPVGPGHEKLVQDAVDSVESQTFRQWECIVVNDTGKELPELPRWVKIISTEGNKGVAHARNTGIRASIAPLFLPLDADDFLEPTALEHMLNAYMDTGYMVYSDFWDLDKPGNFKIHYCDDYDPYLLTGKKRTFMGELREGMIHSVTVLTPKRWWEEVGGYDEKLPGWEDWDFALSLADKGHCSVRVAAPLFTYRKYTGIRREENWAAFEQSKDGIIQKWGKLWEGGKELMACGACQKNRTSYPVSMPQTNGFSPTKISEDEEVVMLRYTGGKQGSTPYKGNSGVIYWFGANDSTKYVLKKDVNLFLRYADFQIINEKPVEQIPEPVLVSEGPPV